MEGVGGPWLGERLAGPPLFVWGAAGSRVLAPPLTRGLGLRDPGAHASAGGDAQEEMRLAAPQRAGGSGPFLQQDADPRTAPASPPRAVSPAVGLGGHRERMPWGGGGRCPLCRRRLGRRQGSSRKTRMSSRRSPRSLLGEQGGRESTAGPGGEPAFRTAFWPALVRRAGGAVGLGGRAGRRVRGPPSSAIPPHRSC